MLKINKIEILPIIQTFGRYEYIINATFSDEDVYYENFQERLDSFLHYLNI